MKRMRGRNHRPNNGGGGGGGGFRNQQNGIPLNRNHVFDSSGPEMRLRGTAQQLHEKYIQLARDASSNGDRVTGEAYYQHAEHYFRIISAINQAAGQTGQPQQGQPQNNGNQNGFQPHNDYQNRRPPNHQNGNGNVYQEPDAEPRFEARQDGNRHDNPRPDGQRHEGPRQDYQRQDGQRHDGPRQDGPRQDGRPEYQDRRQDRPRPAPRPELTPEQMVDRRIDISSALEAELAAAAQAAARAAPAPPAPQPRQQPGLGEQPSLNIPPPSTPRAAEPRAIPIAAAPPVDPAQASPAAEDEAPAVRPRPRGRPRLAKTVAPQE
jgi:hypothetical protein